MTEQEREDRDFMPQSDLQNALARNMMNREPDDSAKIQTALTAGRFVVVMEGPEYCPSTDALMGSRKTMLGDFATREEADVLYQQNREPEHGEVNVYILPHLPLPVAMRVDREEDMPF